MSKRIQQFLSLLGVLVLVVIVTVISVSVHSRQELSRAEEAYTNKEWQRAIIHYERTIKWYTPFGTSVSLAVNRLWELATDAEQRHDLPLALEAYSSLRSGLYAVESWYVPYREWIPRCEEKMASLMASTRAAEASTEETVTQATARFSAQLQRRTAPHIGWSIVTEVGFFGWVGATMFFILRAFSAQGTLLWRQGLLWGSSIVLFFMVWIVGMLFA